MDEQSEVAKIINPETEMLVISDWMKFDSPSFAGDALVVLTEFSIYALQRNDQNLEIKYWNSLLDVREINGKENDTLEITLEKGFLTLSSPQYRIFSDLLQMQLLVLLGDKELPKVSKNIGLKNKGYIPDVSVHKRFVAFCLKNNTHPPVQIVRDMESLLKQFPQTISTSDIPGIENYFDMFLYSLTAYKRVSKLIITGKFNISPYQILAKYISKFRLGWLVLTISPDEHFADLLRALSKLQKNKVARLDFEDCTIDEGNLDQLSMLLALNPVKLLFFEHISFNAPEYKVRNFFNNTVKNTGLEMFGIGTMCFDYREDLLDVLFLMNCLYLQGCGIELDVLLNKLSKSRLNVADFSGARCSQPITCKSLPSSLIRLVLNHIHWKPESLSQIFNLTANHRKNISLSLSYAQMSQNDWNSFFNTKKLSLKNISVFLWSRNPLDVKFRKLISKSAIAYLSLCGCDAQSICEIVENSDNLICLDASGTATRQLKSKVMDVLKSVTKSKSLHHIDLSYNNAGIELQIPFCESVRENKNIYSFIFDGNNFTDFKYFKELCDSVLKNQKVIPALFPYEDFSKMKVIGANVSNFVDAFLVKIPKDQTLEAKEWTRKISGLRENEDPPIDVSEISMIPAPKSDYYPLVRETAFIERERNNEWDVDGIEFPKFDPEPLVLELSKMFSIKNLVNEAMV